jgi:hypothetical protein
MGYEIAEMLSTTEPLSPPLNPGLQVQDMKLDKMKPSGGPAWSREQAAACMHSALLQGLSRANGGGLGAWAYDMWPDGMKDARWNEKSRRWAGFLVRYRDMIINFF